MWNKLNDALEESVGRIIAGIANFLPGMLALLVALAVALPIAWLISRLLQRALSRMGFDERLSQFGLYGVAEWAPSHSPARLMSAIAFWTVIVFGALVGLSALDADLTSHTAERLLALIPNLFLAAILILAGNIIARFFARGVLISAVNMGIHSARFISMGVRWLIQILATAMALDHLGIGGAIVRIAFGILFGGIVLALALALGLGSRDMVARSWQRYEAEQQAAEPSQKFQHF